MQWTYWGWGKTDQSTYVGLRCDTQKKSSHKLSTTVPGYPMMFSGQSPLLQCNTMHQYTTSGILLLCSQAVTKILNIYWLYLSESTSLHSQHLGQTHNAVGHWLLVCLITLWTVQVLDALDVSIYPGPHIGCQFVSWVFSLLLARRGLSTEPMGLKTLRCWIY